MPTGDLAIDCLDDSRDQQSWQARFGETIVGWAAVGPGSDASSRFLRLTVQSDYRRRGVGSALFEQIARRASNSGVTLLMAMVEPGTASERFTNRLGAAIGDELVDDSLDLTDIDLTDWVALRATLPAGYVLEGWHGAAPEELVDSYALTKRFILDAPNRYPPVALPWSAELVRAAEQGRSDRNATLWVSAAVRRDEVVAFSEIEADSSTHASQCDTVVLPDHRRLGLATCVKAALLLRVAQDRPDLREVSVTCAVANTGMRTVNHRLGFRERRRRNLVRIPTV